MIHMFGSNTCKNINIAIKKSRNKGLACQTPISQKGSQGIGATGYSNMELSSFNTSDNKQNAKIL